MLSKLLKFETIRNMSYYSLAQIYAKISQFIVISILVKFLSPNDYGIYGLIFVSYRLFPIIFTGGLSRGLGRLAIEDDQTSFGKVSSLFSLVFTAQGGLLLIFCLILLSTDFLNTVLSGNLIYLAGLIVLGSFSEMMMSYFEIFKRAGVIVKARSIAISIQWLFLLVALQVFENGFLMGILGLYVLELIMVAIYVYHFPKNARRFSLAISKSEVLESLKFSVPLIIYSGSIWFFQFIDRYIIEIYLDLTQLAYYTLAFQLGNTVIWVSEPLNQALSPKYDNEYQTKGKDSLRKMHNKMLSIYLCIAIVAMILSATFSIGYIQLYAPAEYAESLNYVYIIIFGGAFKILYLPFANVIRAVKATALSAKFSIIALLANLILNLIFIPKYGVYGAAWTTAFSFFLLFANYFFLPSIHFQ